MFEIPDTNRHKMLPEFIERFHKMAMFQEQSRRQLIFDIFVLRTGPSWEAETALMLIKGMEVIDIPFLLFLGNSSVRRVRPNKVFFRSQ